MWTKNSNRIFTKIIYPNRHEKIVLSHQQNMGLYTIVVSFSTMDKTKSQYSWLTAGGRVQVTITTAKTWKHQSHWHTEPHRPNHTKTLTRSHVYQIVNKNAQGGTVINSTSWELCTDSHRVILLGDINKGSFIHQWKWMNLLCIGTWENLTNTVSKRNWMKLSNRWKTWTVMSITGRRLWWPARDTFWFLYVAFPGVLSFLVSIRLHRCAHSENSLWCICTTHVLSA